MLIVVQNPLWT